MSISRVVLCFYSLILCAKGLAWLLMYTAVSVLSILLKHRRLNIFCNLESHTPADYITFSGLFLSWDCNVCKSVLVIHVLLFISIYLKTLVECVWMWKYPSIPLSSTLEKNVEGLNSDLKMCFYEKKMWNTRHCT